MPCGRVFQKIRQRPFWFQQSFVDLVLVQDLEWLLDRRRLAMVIQYAVVHEDICASVNKRLQLGGIPLHVPAPHKFSFGQLIGLALDGILNHSVVPLRIATYLGLLISVATFLGTVGYGIGRLVFGKDWPAGFATIVVLILGSLSLNALFLGVIGEYLGRIYRQVKRRPLTIIERELNAPDVGSESAPSTAWGAGHGDR